jgi:AcrR family transcriptional regulator
MELILTSFGLSHLHPTLHDFSIFDHFAQRGVGLFYGMPPISMSAESQKFMLEYSVLLLCERIILDAESFERLSKGEHHERYDNIAEVMKALFDEGFVRVEDFRAIIDQNKELLDRMLKRDLKRLDDWIQPLKESTQTWQHFAESLRDFFGAKLSDKIKELGVDRESSQGKVEFLHLVAHFMPSYYRPDINHMVSNALQMLREALDSSTKRRRSEYREVLREALTGYLAYVNANLVLSRTLEVGFHDWYDFEPFYREKFLTIGQEDRLEEKRIQKVKQLFDISFPEFMPSDTKSLLKAIKDKRISDLRSLVDKAAKEEIQFDKEFANRVLQEVLGVEQRVGRLRNIVSYATLPIGYVPLVGTPMQKAVEEVVDRIAESKIRRPYRWFYLISKLGNKEHK